MKNYRCKICGGTLKIVSGNTIAECDYCGTIQTIPALDNEKKISLFSRANRLRIACEFDKAANIYESIIAEFPEEAEAYWGLLLCKYGIEYVDDPDTAKKIPVCHNPSFECVQDNSDYRQVLENADIISRKLYEEEAQTIEVLRKRIIEVSNNEEPYDIFICYKESDENGERTLDSVLAQRIYNALSELEYRVFISCINLKNKQRQEAIPYIFAALNSAKVMVVIGTNVASFDDVWVKNEWNQFLKMISTGQDKLLIPCFQNINTSEFSHKFGNLQAMDMGKIGFIEKLIQNISRFIGRERQESRILIKAESYLEIGFRQLEAGNKKEAIGFFQNAIKLDATYSFPYLGLLAADDDEKKIIYYQKYISLYKKDDEKLEDHFINKASKSLYDFAYSFILCGDEIRFLKCLKNILNVNLEYNEKTLLCSAIQTRNLTMVKQLVNCGADVNMLCNDDQMCPVGICCEKKQPEILSYLLQHEALTDIEFEWEYIPINPITMCINKNFKEGVILLLDYGVSPDAEVYDDGTQRRILSKAIMEGKKEICDILLTKGADINMEDYEYEDNSEKIPVFLNAFLRDDDTMIPYVIDKGADINIHWEYMNESYDVIRFLICNNMLDKIKLLNQYAGKITLDLIKTNKKPLRKIVRSCKHMRRKTAFVVWIIVSFIVMFFAVRSNPDAIWVFPLTLPVTIPIAVVVASVLCPQSVRDEICQEECGMTIEEAQNVLIYLDQIC